MPLPFLKKKEVSVVAPTDHVTRESDESSEESEYDMLESAAEELISAIQAKDTKAVCSALRSAFQMLEMEPHEESSNDD
jgi:hypothetical protein